MNDWREVLAAQLYRCCQTWASQILQEASGKVASEEAKAQLRVWQAQCTAPWKEASKPDRQQMLRFARELARYLADVGGSPYELRGQLENLARLAVSAVTPSPNGSKEPKYRLQGSPDVHGALVEAAWKILKKGG